MRKTMIFAGFLAIVAIVACQKEADILPVDEGKTTLHFGIGDATKTVHTGAVEMLWADGDDISVDTPAGFKTFALVDGQGSADGTFQINQTVTVNADATSVYPASLAPAWVDDKLSMTLPASYDWAEGAVKAPMIAWLNNAYPYFHLLGGVVKVDVYGVPASATKLVVTTNNQNVSGTFIMQANNTIATSAGTNNTLTLNFTAGTASNMTFYVPLPVGTYTNITFSVQSATETFKTVKASSITVARDQLVFAPALTFGAAAKVTLVDTAMDCTSWSKWNQKDGVNTSVLEVGGRLRFNVTEGDLDAYWQLKPYYADAEWQWVPFNPYDYNTYGLTPGQTAFDIPLNETVVTALRERNSIVLQGYNVTVNSIEYIPAVETVLWEGEHELGDWSNSFDVQGLNTAGFWSGLKAGKELSIYFFESPLPAIDYCQFFVQKKSGYDNIDGLMFNAGTNLYQTVYSYTLTADQVSAIKESGIVINGKKITITKITLR